MKIKFFLLILFTTYLNSQEQSKNFIAPEGNILIGADLHTHTVFSDGMVWPSIRTEEAEREGFELIAITDHLEYQPKKEDIPNPDFNRSYQIAKKSVEGGDLIVIPGSEITRHMPPGHFNAIFIKDANKLLIESDSIAGIYEANKQGAFVFWNHPMWGSQAPDGVARLSDMHKDFITQDLMHGIEIVNTDTYSEEAFQIALDNNLALIGTSDVHNLIEWDYDAYKNEHRPVTLILAKRRTEESIREALFDRRTVVVYKDRLIGRNDDLMPLLESILAAKSDGYRRGTNILKVELSNNSSSDMSLKNLSEVNFSDSDDFIVVPKKGSVILNIKTLEKLKNLNLQFEVQNALTAPKQNPVIEFEIEI